MSSFIINKQEYIKAAGIIAGISNASADSIGDRFWHYNYQECRPYNESDYYKEFCKFFNYNALSVKEQYNLENTPVDDNEYKDIFNKYLKKGKRYYTYKRSKETQNAVMHLRGFFESCIYQTENKSYSTEMRNFFNQLLVNLMPYAISVDRDSITSWGSLDI